MQTKTYSGIELKYLHEFVTNILTIAHGYEGVAFGGYVRDVIPKILAQNFDEVEVKDLDIWFRTEDGRDGFVKAACKYLTKGIKTSSSAGEGLLVENYGIKDSYGEPLLWTDLVVSETFPVNDFNINMLTWDVVNKCFTTHSTESVPEILAYINKKRAIISEKYLALVQSNKHSYKCRLYMRFLSKGWRIFYKNKEIILFYQGKPAPLGLNELGLRRAKVEAIDIPNWLGYTGYTKEQLQKLSPEIITRERPGLMKMRESMANEGMGCLSEDIAFIDSLFSKPINIDFDELNCLVLSVEEGKLSATEAYGNNEQLYKDYLDKLEKEKCILERALQSFKIKPLSVHEQLELLLKDPYIPDKYKALLRKLYVQ